MPSIREAAMVIGGQGSHINKTPAAIGYTTGMGAFWGTCVAFPVWGFVSFFLSRTINPELSLSLAALLSGAIVGALAAYLTRTRPSL
jgi:hypothetical protein